MSKKKRNESCDGFEEWGGYMGAKKAKLIQQFALDNENTKSNETKIFSGIAIFVNGYTVPSADELKILMIKYGGTYHHYYDSKRTTHVIASNLPNCKMKQLKTMKVIKPEWITDSIKANSLLDFRNYLLYTNQSKTQPRLLFGSSNISSSDKTDFEKGDLSVGNPVVSTEITSDNRSDIDVNKLEKGDKKEKKYDGDVVLKVDEISPCNSKEMEVEMSLVSKFSEECENEIKDDLVTNYVQKSRFSTKESPTNLINNSNKNPDSTKNVTNTNKGNSSRMTASDANFLSEFYSNSRLHHISTMGATFKQYVNELRHKNNGMFQGRDKIKQWLDEQKRSSINEDDDENEDESCVASRTDISEKTIIMHIDMDCFFVSVGIRNKPHLKGQPVAVTHAKANNSDKNLRTGVDFKAEIELYKNRIESKNKPRTSTVKNDSETTNESNNVSLHWISMIGENDSMSEIASCSYEARKAGIKNGMFLGQALKMCPNLKTIPYDFEAYKEVSYMLYDTIAEYTLDIEAVSCDEMFVDCTNLLKYISCSPMEFATYLRNQIKQKTGCPCSTGFGSNRLQARLSTKKAKPDGQYYLQQQDLMQVMKDVNVTDLPGVGKALACKLSAMNITTCLDLQSYSLSELRCEFGNKTGEALYNHCRGIDDRNLTFGHVRKSVSAEVNYGIRFQNQDEAEKFLHQLSSEVRNRLQEVQMKAKCITLKLMVKAKDAPEKTAKFLGHGFCDSISKSSSFTLPIADISVISREVISIYRKLGISPKDLRGIGIQLSRLVPECSSEGRIGVLDAFLKPNVKPKPLTHERRNKTSDSSENADKVSTNKNNFFTKRNLNKTESKVDTSECIKHLDEGVLAELPEDIRKEIINQYKEVNYDNISENLQSISALQKRRSDVSNNEHHLPVTNNTGYENKFSFSQIDQSFVNALPIQLQEEIKCAFSSNKPKIIQNCDDDGLDVKRLGKPTKVKFKDEVPMAEVECESLDQMRDMVRTWVTEESSPQPNDVIMIYSTIVKLVYKHCLSDLTILINTLCRSVRKKNLNHSWKEAYTEIIRLVQEVMKTEYGGELKLECDIND